MPANVSDCILGTMQMQGSSHDIEWLSRSQHHWRQIRNGWNTSSSVPNNSHANIMPSYPTHRERVLYWYVDQRGTKSLIREPHYLTKLWGGARCHIRNMRRCDGIIHEAGQVTNLSIECSVSVMRWTCPTVAQTSRARIRQISSWLLSLTVISIPITALHACWQFSVRGLHHDIWFMMAVPLHFYELLR